MTYVPVRIVEDFHLQTERTPNVITAAIYARVSTDDQKKHGISLDDQVATCALYAEVMDYDVVYTGIEGLSDKDTDKPELQHILSLVNKKAINHVLMIKLDRLSRDTEDSLRIGKMVTKKSVGLHLVMEGGFQDLNDPAVEAMFIMRAELGTVEQQNQIRKDIRILVYRIARIKKVKPPEIWNELKVHFGGQSQSETSLSGLRNREKFLREWKDQLMTDIAQQQWYGYEDERDEEFFESNLIEGLTEKLKKPRGDMVEAFKEFMEKDY